KRRIDGGRQKKAAEKSHGRGTYNALQPCGRDELVTVWTAAIRSRASRVRDLTRYNRRMRRSMAVIVWMMAASASAQTSFRTYGFLTLREIYVKSQPSWSTGGWGRFDVGARNADSRKTVNVDVLQLGIDWTPTRWLLLHTDGLARREQSGTVGKRAGFLQAYGDLHTERLRLRAGLFWLPTSLE